MFEDFKATFRDSVYNPIYYETFHERPLSGSFAYLTALAAALALVTAVMVTIEFIPAYQSFTASGTAADYIPAGLVVTIKDGVASSTATEPLPLAKPAAFAGLTQATNLVVIDTKETHDDPALLRSLDTFAVLTHDAIIVESVNGANIITLSGAPDITIDRALIAALDTWLADHPANIAFGYFLGVFVRQMLAYVAYLLYFVLFTFIAMAIGYFCRLMVPCRDAYAATMHSFTLPLIANAIFTVAGIAIPFWLWGPTFSAMLLYMNWRPPKEEGLDDELQDPENPYR